MATFSNKSLKECMGWVWAATLEVWAHQILYVRRVYPQETFISTEYQGITTCRVCRHPEVVSYIHDTVQAAVPALLRGTATEIALTIVERDSITETVAMEWEVYKLRMLNLDMSLMEHTHSSSRNSNVPSKSDLLQQLERGLRNLILKVHGLPHGHVTTANSSLDQLSFQITLKIAKEDPSCTQLAEGFKTGTWNETSSPHNVQEQRKEEPLVDLVEDGPNKTARVLRPLHLVNTELCRVDFSMTRMARVQPTNIRREKEGQAHVQTILLE
ncbi:hypothetical protein ACA910_020731 [Epithemia clementina (nom. ined.)]